MSLRITLLPLAVVVARGFVLVRAPFVRRAFAPFVVAALRPRAEGSAGQEAKRGQGEDNFFHGVVLGVKVSDIARTPAVTS